MKQRTRIVLFHLPPAARGRARSAPDRPQAAGWPQPKNEGHLCEGLRLPIELAERHSRLYTRDALFRVNMHRPHRRQVNQKPAVADRVASDVVAATAHRHEQAVVARKAYGTDHIACGPATHDRTWSPIDHRIPNRPRLVVTGFIRKQRLPWSSECRAVRMSFESAIVPPLSVRI
jgi:hypothetical protein